MCSQQSISFEIYKPLREFPNIKRKNGGKIQKDLEPNTEPKSQTLVETTKAENWTDFGFLAFRTDYSNEDLWVQFLEKYNEILDEEIENAPIEPALSRVAECVL